MIVNGIECHGLLRNPIEGDPEVDSMSTFESEFGTGVIVRVDKDNTFEESPYWRGKVWGDGLINPTFGQAAVAAALEDQALEHIMLEADLGGAPDVQAMLRGEGEIIAEARQD